MNIKTIFVRIHHKRQRPRLQDYSENWTTRDWADLPVHHPRDPR